MKKYPKQIIVFRNNEGQDDEWFEVSEKLFDAACMDQPRIVGLYELKDTVTLTTEVKVNK